MEALKLLLVSCLFVLIFVFPFCVPSTPFLIALRRCLPRLSHSSMLSQVGPYVALPTDKDGGFCLVPKNSLRQQRSAIFQRANYKEIQCTLEGLQEDVLCDFNYVVGKAVKRCKHIAPEDQHSLVHIFQAPWRLFSGSLFSSLKVTCKTHKDPGDFEMRPIHSSPSSPHSSAMKFIMWCLKPALKRIRHLLRNSKHVRDQLANLRIPEGAKFIKVDIKDYYLSGEHAEFSRAATQCVDPEWQIRFQAVLTHLLDNQYIKDDTDKHGRTRSFKVILGAGMGIAYVGDLCDATFWFLAERQFADNIHVHKRFSIYAYFRFRDDILIIAGGTSVSRQRFLQVLRQKASFWVLKVSQYHPMAARSWILL